MPQSGVSLGYYQIVQRGDGIWYGRGLCLPPNEVLYGIVRGETKPGLYRFEFESGSGHRVVDDAHLLCPDSDFSGNGDYRKPRNPSPAVGVSGPGGSVWIIGFIRPPRFDDSKNDAPAVGNADDNQVGGDWVRSTAGGARIMLKHGGAVVLEGGPLASLSLNPVNGTIAQRSQNLTVATDGFAQSRGRVEPGSTKPATVTTDEFYSQVGPAATRIRLRHGSIGSDIARELTVATIAAAAGGVTGKVMVRETYGNDGSWTGEGPSYKWGGELATERAVLGDALVSMMKDIIDLLKNFKVITPSGPSTGLTPDTVVQLEEIAPTHLDSGKILSNYIYLSKLPRDPGVVKD